MSVLRSRFLSSKSLDFAISRQYGTMLVLFAVYKYNYWNISLTITMQHLFKRTTSFLGEHSAISQTSAYDCSLLKWLREVVFEG